MHARQHRPVRFGFLIRRTILALTAVLFLGALASAETIRVGLGYLPNIQFAPFYAAQSEGFYEAEGLTVEFQHGFSTELFPLLAQDKLDFVVADAEDAISLRAQDPEGAPFVYVMALYQQIPNAVFSLADTGITEPADLAGKTLGIPGLFGTSYTALQAVLRAGGLSESDVTVQQIGFTQLEAVVSGRVDAALGFINNEPLILERQGVAVDVIPVGPLSPSVGNGVITSTGTLETPDLARRFLAATLRGVEQTLNAPEQAVEASAPFLPDLTEEAKGDALEVLRATIPLYSSAYSESNGLGAIEPERWNAFFEQLKESGRLETAQPANVFYSNEYLPR